MCKRSLTQKKVHYFLIKLVIKITERRYYWFSPHLLVAPALFKLGETSSGQLKTD